MVKQKMIGAPLSNQRHERFAQEIAQGRSATEAYRTAGYDVDATTANACASRLLANAKVQERVLDLKSSAAANTALTVATLIGYAEDARRKAMEQGQCSAAVSAIKELGVLSGLRVEKTEKIRKTAREMTDAELEAIIAESLEAEGRPLQ